MAKCFRRRQPFPGIDGQRRRHEPDEACAAALEEPAHPTQMRPTVPRVRFCDADFLGIHLPEASPLGLLGLVVTGKAELRILAREAVLPARLEHLLGEPSLPIRVRPVRRSFPESSRRGAEDCAQMADRSLRRRRQQHRLAQPKLQKHNPDRPHVDRRPKWHPEEDLRGCARRGP
eukprot:scaffold7891_cov277-Pinguiococcus_pyrenoidosus.AAC.1